MSFPLPESILYAFLFYLFSVLGISGGMLLLYLPIHNATSLNVGSYGIEIHDGGGIGRGECYYHIPTYLMKALHPKQKIRPLYAPIGTRAPTKANDCLEVLKLLALMPDGVKALSAGAQMHQPLAIAVIGGFLVALPPLSIIFPTLLNKIQSKHTEE